MQKRLLKGKRHLGDPGQDGGRVKRDSSAIMFHFGSLGSTGVRGRGKRQARGCLPGDSLQEALPPLGSHVSRRGRSRATRSPGGDLADGRRPAVWKVSSQDAN